MSKEKIHLISYDRQGTGVSTAKKIWTLGIASLWVGENRRPADKEIEKDGIIYVASFSYHNFKNTSSINFQYDADLADFKIKVEAEARKRKKSESESSENNDNEKPKYKPTHQTNPNDGEFNKLFEKVKELETDFKKSTPEKVQDAKEIMKELEEKNRSIREEMENKLEKLKEEKNNLSQQIKQAMEKSNKTQIAVISAKMKEVDSKIDEIAEDIVSIPGKEWVEKYFKDMEKERNKSFFEKINWKSPRTYLKLGISFVAIFIIVLLIYYIIRKIISFFSHG